MRLTLPYHPFASYFHFGKPKFQFVNPLIDDSSVGLDLLFTGTTTCADTPFDAFEVCPHPLESRSRVLELSQLDLKSRFRRAGVRGKNIENQFTSIDDDPLGFLFEMSTLTGGEIVVENDQFGTCRIDQVFQFNNLSFAEAGSGMGTTPHLDKLADDFDAGCFHKTFQFIKRLFFSKISTRIRNGDENGGTRLNFQVVANGVGQVRFRSGQLKYQC